MLVGAFSMDLLCHSGVLLGVGRWASTTITALKDLTPINLILAVVVISAACYGFGYWMGTPAPPAESELVSVFTKPADDGMWHICVSNRDGNMRQVDTILVINKEEDTIEHVSTLVNGHGTGIANIDRSLDWDHVADAAPNN